MSRTQYTVASILAIIAILSALFFCGAQAMRTLTTTQGMSLAQYVAFTGNMVLGLLLALSGYRKNPGPIIKQQIAVFGVWTICGLGLITVFIYVGNFSWSTMDTVIATSAAVGFTGTVAGAKIRKVSLKDPAVVALNAISLKSVPQFFLVWLILSEGGDGLTLTAIVAGFISVTAKFIPIGMSLRKEGVNRDKKWLLIAEGINGISWIGVTIAWSVV